MCSLVFRPSHLIASGVQKGRGYRLGSHAFFILNKRKFSQSAFDQLSDQSRSRLIWTVIFYNTFKHVVIWNVLPWHWLEAVIHAAYFSTGNSANCLFLLDVAIKVEVRVPPALVIVYSCFTQQNLMCKCLGLPWLPCPPFYTIYIESITACAYA